MTNILVNGIKSKVGGGKAILDNYITLLRERNLNDNYYILTPNIEEYSHMATERIIFIDFPSWAHSNLATIPLYRVLFPRLIKRMNINAILNFGDIVIPTNIPQLYLFDWAFAVYPDHVSWKHLSWLEWFTYSLKLHFFRAYLSRATQIMAQTPAMRVRLEQRFGLDNVVVVPAAVSRAENEELQSFPLGLPADVTKLVYPANYYPHKNIEIFLQVAEILKARATRIVIVTTLSAAEHDGAEAYLDAISARGLDDILVNVGRLPAQDIPALFAASDGLLMPTLLETFGLPYAEALSHGKPILTSDLDFARAVCGDAALYFDPADPASIIAVIDQLLENADLRRALAERGSARFREMWDWTRVFGEYQRLLQQLRSPIGSRHVSSDDAVSPR